MPELQEVNEAERPLPRPLSSEEIKQGLALLVGEKVWEALSQSCNLYERAYPAFKAKISISLEIEDFGDTVFENRDMEILAALDPGKGEYAPHDGNGKFSGQIQTVSPIDMSVDPMPPNQFRQQTGQEIPKMVNDGGLNKETQRRYRPRRAKAE